MGRLIPKNRLQEIEKAIFSGIPTHYEWQIMAAEILTLRDKTAEAEQDAARWRAIEPHLHTSHNIMTRTWSLSVDSRCRVDDKESSPTPTQIVDALTHTEPNP